MVPEPSGVRRGIGVTSRRQAARAESGSRLPLSKGFAAFGIVPRLPAPIWMLGNALERWEMAMLRFEDGRSAVFTGVTPTEAGTALRAVRRLAVRFREIGASEG